MEAREKRTGHRPGTQRTVQIADGEVIVDGKEAFRHQWLSWYVLTAHPPFTTPTLVAAAGLLGPVGVRLVPQLRPSAVISAP